MWILVKFRNKNVNFMAKNNGHQKFRNTPPPLLPLGTVGGTIYIKAKSWFIPWICILSHSGIICYLLGKLHVVVRPYVLCDIMFCVTLCAVWHYLLCDVMCCVRLCGAGVSCQCTGGTSITRWSKAFRQTFPFSIFCGIVTIMDLVTLPKSSYW